LTGLATCSTDVPRGELALLDGLEGTEHLLAPAGELKEEKQVRLVIEVDVRVSRPRAFNVLFSGD